MSHLTPASHTLTISTSLGDIHLELYEQAAPITVRNFVQLVTSGKYDKTGCFYRVVRDDNQPDDDITIDVIQGGIGFQAYGMKQPTITHEPTRDTGLQHTDGVLSMARLDPGTASSEFFICVGDQPELDYGGQRNPDGQGFAAFGRVTSGMDVVKRIHQSPADKQTLTPSIPIRITLNNP